MKKMIQTIAIATFLSANHLYAQNAKEHGGQDIQKTFQVITVTGVVQKEDLNLGMPGMYCLVLRADGKKGDEKQVYQLEGGDVGRARLEELIGQTVTLTGRTDKPGLLKNRLDVTAIKTTGTKENSQRTTLPVILPSTGRTTNTTHEASGQSKKEVKDGDGTLRSVRVLHVTFKKGLKTGDMEFLKDLARPWFFLKEPSGLPVLEEGNTGLFDRQNKVVGFGTKAKDKDIGAAEAKYGKQNVTIKAGDVIYVDVKAAQVLDAKGELLMEAKAANFTSTDQDRELEAKGELLMEVKEDTRNLKQPSRTGGEQTSKAKKELEASNRLPPFTEQLDGTNPVRVRNPNNFAVATGLRTGEKGRNFDVPANGVNTVYIPNGRYDIYFVYSDKPDALFQGDSFTLSNNGVEIQIVKVVNGNYGIRQVK